MALISQKTEGGYTTYTGTGTPVSNSLSGNYGDQYTNITNGDKYICISGTWYTITTNGISLTSLSASSPLSYNNGTGAFSIQAANTTQNGYLTSTDWNTFNNKENAITATGNSIDYYSGNKTFLPLPISGFTSFYFSDNASDINTYKNLETSTTLGTEYYVTKTSPLNLDVIQAFSTLANVPNVLFINAGTYLIHIHAYKTGGTKNVSLYGEIYKRNLAGTETLLGTTSYTSLLSTSEQDLGAVNVYIGNTVLLATDRIVVKIRASITGGGSAPTSITIGYSDGTGSRLDIPMSQADLSVYALKSSPLSQFASTTSAQLAAVISDETGTGNVVFSNSPALSGTPTAPTQTALDNSTKIATTAYVDSAAALKQNLLGYTPENAANKDVSGGYVGLTLYKINFKNTANTFTSFLTNSNTAARTYTFQDRNGTIADNTDLATKENTIIGAATTITQSNLTANRLLISDTNGKVSNNAVTNTEAGYLSGVTSAIQTQLNSKQATISLTTTGSSGAATFVTNTLNIPTYTLAGLGGISLTSLSASTPLSYNNTTGAFTIQVANTTQNGYLTSTDWNTFNNKQNAATNLTSIGGLANATGWLYNNGSGTFSYSSPNTSQVTESGNLYFTNSRAIGATLTGYTSTTGTISSADSILSAIQKLNGNIGLLSGSVIYQGTWNATTNVSPTLASGVGTKGYYYKVSVAGTTTIDGISKWDIGDMIIFNGTTWDKIEGLVSDVSSVFGRVGAVVGAAADYSGVAMTGITSLNGLVITANNGTITTGTWNGSAISDTYISSATNWNNAYTNRITSLTTTGSSGAATLLSNVLNIPTYTLAGLGGQAALSGTGFVKISGTTISYDNSTYYLASNPSGYTSNTGTVTSVAALTIGTTGTDVSSTVATGTTTPVITLNIPDASATARGLITINAQTINGTKTFGSNPIFPISSYVTPVDIVGISATGVVARISASNARTAFGQATTSTDGYLSSTDWNTFNGKQGAITLTTTGTSGAATLVGNTLNIPQYGSSGITGTGTSGQVAYFTGTGTQSSNSVFLFNGTTVGINALNPSAALNIETTLTNGIRIINTNTTGLAKSALFSTQGTNSTGANQAISASSSGSTIENIGGVFAASGTNPYALQLSDGTEGAGKFLKSVTSAGKANWATLTSTDVGLGNVDNTSDVNKPVSTAQATSIATKAPKGINVIYVETSGGDYTDIATALASITTNTTTNRYIIHVGVGSFNVDNINLAGKPYVSIVGSSIEETIFKSNGTNHMFLVGPYNEISFCTMQGALSAGKFAISCDNTGNYGQCHKVSFLDCNGILVNSTSVDTYFYAEYVDFNGTYTYGVKTSSSGGFISYFNGENIYNYPTAGTPTFYYITGTTSTMYLSTSNNEYQGGGIAGTGILLENGATLVVNGLDIKNTTAGLSVPNTGSAPSLRMQSTVFLNNTTDISVLHTTTIGTIDCVIDSVTISNSSSLLLINYRDITNNKYFIPNLNMTGTSVATTQSPLDNSTKVATTAYVDAAVTAGGGGGGAFNYGLASAIAMGNFMV